MAPNGDYATFQRLHLAGMDAVHAQEERTVPLLQGVGRGAQIGRSPRLLGDGIFSEEIDPRQACPLGAAVLAFSLYAHGGHFRAGDGRRVALLQRVEHYGAACGSILCRSGKWFCARALLSDREWVRGSRRSVLTHQQTSGNGEAGLANRYPCK